MKLSKARYTWYHDTPKGRRVKVELLVRNRVIGGWRIVIGLMWATLFLITMVSTPIHLDDILIIFFIALMFLIFGVLSVYGGHIITQGGDPLDNQYRFPFAIKKINSDFVAQKLMFELGITVNQFPILIECIDNCCVEKMLIRADSILDVLERSGADIQTQFLNRLSYAQNAVLWKSKPIHRYRILGGVEIDN